MSEVSKLENLVQELRRRSVIKVAAVYAALAWLILQFADIAFPRLGLPDWTITFVLVLAAVGFPFALFFSWVYETTSDGLVVTPPMTEAEKKSTSGRKLDFFIIAALSLVVGFLYLERLGYEFFPSAVVSEQSTESGDTLPVRAPSIAVLPFDNLSSNNENEYFAAGIHEDILTHLSRIEGLKVISRTSMMRYAGNRTQSLKEIGDELEVNHVLEGSVRRSGNQVRITVQLIDATNDGHIWSENYDRDLDNIFEVQSEVAKQVASQLQVELDPDELQQVNAKPTDSIAAYEIYLRARQLMNTAGTDNARQALALYESSVALDPNFANAHAGIAYALMRLSSADTDWDDIRVRATQAARKALELDPLSSEGHHAFGMTLFRSDDFDGAEQELQLALSLDPNNSRAYTDLSQVQLFGGSAEDAYANANRAIELDPLSPDPLLYLAMSLVQNDKEEAFKAIEQAVSLAPTYGPVYSFAANISSQAGDLKRAFDYYAQAIELDPENLETRQLAAFILGAVGLYEVVEQWIAEAERKTPLHDSVFNMKINLMDAQTPLSERDEQFTAEKEALINKFREQDPTDRELTRVTGVLHRDRARFALMNENQEAFRQQSLQAINVLEQQLEPDKQQNGQYRYRFINSWSLMAYFQVLDLSGDKEKAKHVVEGVIAEVEKRPWAAFAETFHRSVAYAYLGDREKSLDALQTAAENGFFLTWVVDMYEAFDYMRNDIRFIEIMSKVRTRNEDTAAYIREKYVNTGRI